MISSFMSGVSIRSISSCCFISVTVVSLRWKACLDRGLVKAVLYHSSQ